MSRHAFGDQRKFNYQIFDSIVDVDQITWRQLCRDAGGDIFADPRFLHAVEGSMRGQARIWHALIYDAHCQAVATASFSLFRADVGILAASRVKHALDLARVILPSLLRPKVLFCGLPVSVGASNLHVVRGADRVCVLTIVDEIMAMLARRERCALLCIKEFGAAELAGISWLARADWTVGEAPAMNRLSLRHSNFPVYLAALRSKRRLDIRRSLRKADAIGVEIQRLVDPEAMIGLYTDDVHQLYVSVVQGSPHQLELLPKEFFHALAKEFSGQVELVYAAIGGQIVAFNWSLTDGDRTYLLFCGIEHRLNRVADLYFNIMYAELDRAMRKGMTEIILGQTADEFKARIGAFQQPRYVCVRGRMVPVSLLLKIAGPALFPRPSRPSTYDIFRAEPKSISSRSSTAKYTSR